MIFQKMKVEFGDISIDVRACEGIVYAAHTKSAEHQSMNIYVPEEYFCGGSINGYTAQTAPVFMPNQVGGYMPAAPMKPGTDIDGRANSVVRALEHGYVVVSAGARGNFLKDENGVDIGHAPACIVDQKAAIRYLRAHADSIPGDMEKIITNGTSAGGAISAIMGATGNCADYEEYLKEAGACEGRDDIFAASCYCPITNLDHADIAYEWQFVGVDDFERMNFRIVDGKPHMEKVKGAHDERQKDMSRELAALFPDYLNSLGLMDENGVRMELDSEGKGSFLQHVKGLIVDSANYEARDLGEYDFLRVDNGRSADVDFGAYVKFITRMKSAPAFDAMEMNTPENALFGSAENSMRHFTDFRHECGAEKKQLDMMNPMEHIGAEGNDVARHWRIRHGAADRDTSFAIPAMLALKLKNAGCEVDFRMPWGVPHSGDYDLDELFAWIDGIVQK